MKSLGRSLVGTALLGLLVLLGLMLYGDAAGLGRSLGAFDWAVLPPVLLLSLGNYGLRFFKWQGYLRCLGLRLRPWPSLLIFGSGFALTVTPGKLGEALKSVLLKEAYGVALARTAPIVVAERFTDFLAVMALAVFGAVAWNYGLNVLVVAATLAAAFVGLLSSPRLARAFLRGLARLPLVRRAAPALGAAYESMAAMLRPWPLLWTTALSVAAWFCEAAGLYLVVNALPGVTCDLATAVFVYAFATLAGAVTLLPGGIGATEGTLVGLLQKVFAVVPRAEDATAATLIIRFCTLWFAVLLGLVALAAFRVRQRRGGNRAAELADAQATAAPAPAPGAPVPEQTGR